jgi:hypothetical protein
LCDFRDVFGGPAPLFFFLPRVRFGQLAKPLEFIGRDFEVGHGQSPRRRELKAQLTCDCDWEALYLADPARLGGRPRQMRAPILPKSISAARVRRGAMGELGRRPRIRSGAFAMFAARGKKGQLARSGRAASSAPSARLDRIAADPRVDDKPPNLIRRPWDHPYIFAANCAG